jgi:thymidine kinase
MYFARSGGWIEVICGVMFSGKSEELIRRVRRAIIAKKKVQVFKSHLDERYAGIYHISSHDGRTVDAAPVDTCDHIARAIAEVVDKLNAICVKCGNPASRNQRLIAGRPARYDSPTIMVGSAESYEARCRACHAVPRRDEDQVALL